MSLWRIIPACSDLFGCIAKILLILHICGISQGNLLYLRQKVFIKYVEKDANRNLLTPRRAILGMINFFTVIDIIYDGYDCLTLLNIVLMLTHEGIVDQVLDMAKTKFANIEKIEEDLEIYLKYHSYFCKGDITLFCIFIIVNTFRFEKCQKYVKRCISAVKDV